MLPLTSRTDGGMSVPLFRLKDEAGGMLERRRAFPAPTDFPDALLPNLCRLTPRGGGPRDGASLFPQFRVDRVARRGGGSAFLLAAYSHSGFGDRATIPRYGEL